MKQNRGPAAAAAAGTVSVRNSRRAAMLSWARRVLCGARDAPSRNGRRRRCQSTARAPGGS